MRTGDHEMIYIVVKEVLELQPHNIDTITTIEQVFHDKSKAQEYIAARNDGETYYIVKKEVR